MNVETARYLNAINARFYNTVHESFSATRNNAWPGWVKAETYMRTLLPASADEAIQVLDLACGNMRFEKYLSSLALAAYEVHCVDNCRAMADLGLAHRFEQCDLVSCLIDSDEALESHILAKGRYDLAVCFGFFHHVPGGDRRKHLLSMILDALKPGGLAIISLWRFMDNKSLSLKALRSHAEYSRVLADEGLQLDQLEDGDFLLAWQDRKDVCRYCHHFSDEEIDGLVDSAYGKAQLLARYREDGKDRRSNEYLVLQRS